MNNSSSWQLLSFREVGDVEKRPGLYAWYLRMRLGRNTNSAENTTRALQKIVERLYYPTMDIRLRGHLSLKLRGDLQHIWYGHEKYPFTSQLQSVLQLPEEREMINQIFEAAVPLLTCPLYIGVSKNLNGRLEQHKKYIQTYRKDKKIAESLASIPIDSIEASENDRAFAERVVERQIDPNDLAVGVMYMSDPQISDTRVREIVEAAETLLNRIFHPILGRR